MSAENTPPRKDNRGNCMNEFKNYHPAVNFMYFTAVIVFSMVFTHPLCLAISLISAFAYSIMLSGKKAAKLDFFCLAPMILVSALINPAFSHGGVTILCYLPSGNPLTLESILYGAAAGMMLVTVICWFSCYNKVMTSDKFIYLFGRIIPALSLILSMVLRFVPRFITQLKDVSKAQKCIGRDISQGNIVKRAKNGITIISIMITWALENSIETADSMKSRGYGLSGRSAFSIFTIENRDKAAITYILTLAVYLIIGAARDGMYFTYFPYLQSVSVNIYAVSLFTAYLLLCAMPIVIELWEVRKWRAIKSRI